VRFFVVLSYCSSIVFFEIESDLISYFEAQGPVFVSPVCLVALFNQIVHVEVALVFTFGRQLMRHFVMFGQKSARREI